jgi:ribonuclease-3
LRDDLKRLQISLNFEFANPKLLDTALSHRSSGLNNNERSEFLGDSILGFVIADLLFHKFPEADEGQLSRLRASLVKKETLADIARQLSVGSYLKLGAGELRSGGHARDSILADALEAIIAAIYLDSDYQRARLFILELYEIRLQQLTLTKGRKDPKTRLQEWLQSEKMELPVYEVIKSSGPQHKQQFVVSCTITSMKVTTTGKGQSKRKAEQDAAEKMLEQYEQA